MARGTAPMIGPSPARGIRPRLAVVLVLGVLLVLLAGAGFAALESSTVSNYWDGLWWALSLMTTVGFVGETPETTGGRILSAVLMVSGFALLTVTTAAVASLFVREEEQPAEALDRAFEGVVLRRLDEMAQRLEAIERAFPQPSAGPRGADRTRPGATSPGADSP
ncbi:MAG: potassium channel family protein [Solirubrobacteraceae bacterium]